MKNRGVEILEPFALPAFRAFVGLSRGAAAGAVAAMFATRSGKKMKKGPRKFVL
jgi:hypothetical protein